MKIIGSRKKKERKKGKRYQQKIEPNMKNILSKF